ncbi:MAG TPA: mechanosensitive ion channel [Sedimenticola thiotaurini]|uniref:Mechanosensitive ion channel n=1 Tax=Sedimenticola thiotaurini TaxID=1543721 RepID=A0A831RNY0_9GAMM|nr:mechanosensitive ion channel [Sedimenticola thiotaurini]
MAAQTDRSDHGAEGGHGGVRRLFHCLWLLLLLPLSVVGATGTTAEEPVPPPGNGVVKQLSEAALEARIADMGDPAGLGKEEKKILAQLQSALKLLKQAGRDSQASAHYKEVIDRAGDVLGDLRTRLGRLQSVQTVRPNVEAVLDLDTLEQRLDQAQAESKVLEGKLADLESQITNEQKRPEQIGGEISAIKQELNGVDRDLARLAREGATDPLASARRIELMATQKALGSRLNRLQLERLSSSPRLERMRLQADLYREQIKQLDGRIQRLQALISDKRKRQAEQALEEAEQARREALNKHPLIKAAAGINAELGDRLGQLTSQLDQAVRDRQRSAEALESIERKLERARQQLDVLRFDDAFGTMLRRYQQSLPDRRRLQKRLDQTRQKMSEVRLKQFQVDDRRQQLLDRLAGYVSDARERPPGLSDAEWAGLEAELTKLDRDRLDLLNRLQETYGRLEKILSDLESEQQRQLARVEAYNDLLDRNLIWIPSTKPIDWQQLAEIRAHLSRLLAPERLRQVLDGSLSALRAERLKAASLLLLVLLMLALRPRIRRGMEAMVERVGNVSRDRFSLTLEALFGTLILAMPWVVLLAGLGEILKSEPPPIGEGLGKGLLYLALYFSLIQTIRWLFVRHGLAEVHFRWPAALVVPVRRHMAWFVAYSVLVGAMTILVHMEDDPLLRDNVGRIVSMAWLAGLWLLSHLLLNPWSGIGVTARPRFRDAVFCWRFVVYLAVMVLFLLLIVLEIEGYRYTVFRLVIVLVDTLWVALLVLLFYNLAVRWLLVAERRMALVRAREKRQALIEARATKEAADAAGESIHEVPELEEINLSTISGQTRRLLRLAAGLLMIAALFPIWSQLTPLVTWMDEIVLWQHTVSVGTKEQLVPVSLWDLALNLLLLVLMVAAARNLPGLLEIAILEPLKMGRGSRYAISKLVSYLIYTVGTVLAFRVMGIGWGDIQWLVAAMGVGLGFGLQEIFANLVSGLIILFERPIRIGDTVTIGEVSGTVSRMRMRATTITDWDNKELIIPNKAFVTDPLINWTLSDPITRIVIPVGIAYGSDTALAHRVMMDVVRSHPDVMEEPRPTVFFTAFGDSALEFEVRVFVSERLKRMPLTHDIHMALDRALAEAGIEIPFPQRDLHLRSVDPDIDLGNGRGSGGRETE